MQKILLVVFLFSRLNASSQAGSEIFLFDCRVENGQVFLSRGTNITHHKGYDNQPSFHPSKTIIYYSSFNDSGRSDIKLYNYTNKETNNFTLTDEREYSPTVTPDEKFISCIIQRNNGAQDLGKFPLNGGGQEILINDLKVAYHAWAEKDKLFLVALGDSNTTTLHLYNLSNKADKALDANIGRSLHKIPGQHAMSFIKKISEKESIVKRYDISTGAITTIVSSLPGKDDVAWLQNNILLMSDGNKLFSYNTGKEVGWQPVIIEGDAAMLKGITRLATNNTNTKLAVVVSE